MSRSDSRVPVMMSEKDLGDLLHAINETAPIERPDWGTIQKLITALRRVDPERVSSAWETVTQIEADR